MSEEVEDEVRVECSMRWATVVREVADAFAFVMEHLDDLDDVQIQISPIWWHADSDEDPPCHRRYEVSIAGRPR